MKSNKFEGREQFVDPILDTLQKIENQLIIPETGLLVVFETRILQFGLDFPEEAFYIAHKVYKKNGPAMGTPLEIATRLGQNDWEHFIWIPQKFCHPDKVQELVMRYGHELQHYQQSLNPKFIQDAKIFLRHLKKSGFQQSIFKNKRLAAEELDAHRVAFNIFEEILGTDTLTKYIEVQSVDPTSKKFYKELQWILTQWENFFA